MKDVTMIFLNIFSEDAFRKNVVAFLSETLGYVQRSTSKKSVDDFSKLLKKIQMFEPNSKTTLKAKISKELKASLAWIDSYDPYDLEIIKSQTFNNDY